MNRSFNEFNEKGREKVEQFISNVFESQQLGPKRGKQLFLDASETGSISQRKKTRQKSRGIHLLFDQATKKTTACGGLRFTSSLVDPPCKVDIISIEMGAATVFIPVIYQRNRMK